MFRKRRSIDVDQDIYEENESSPECQWVDTDMSNCSSAFDCSNKMETEMFSYHPQMAFLREQLEAVMMENEQMASEIRLMKNNDEVSQLRQQLKREAEKNRLLLENLQDSNSDMERSPTTEEQSPNASPKRFVFRRRTMERNHSLDQSECLATSSTVPNSSQLCHKYSEKGTSETEAEDQKGTKLIKTPSRANSWFRSTEAKFWSFVGEIIKDFSETNEGQVEGGNGDGAPLSVKKKWKLRFLSSLQKLETSDNVDAAPDSKIGDKCALVLSVARKVQNVLGAASNTAEKIKNLLLWETTATCKVYFLLWLLLITSINFWASEILVVAGLYLAGKVFLVDYVFFRFPRIRKKYDSTNRLWDDLPTDMDLERKLKESRSASEVSGMDTQTFLETFNLPSKEVPLSGWQSGKRCALVNRDRSLASPFKNGRLYLTSNYLCFERSRTQQSKNVLVPLKEIIRIEKINSSSWVSGGSFTIEVMVEGAHKSYCFGGVLNRDDVYDAIICGCNTIGCSPVEGESSCAENKKENLKCEGTDS